VIVTVYQRRRVHLGDLRRHGDHRASDAREHRPARRPGVGDAGSGADRGPGSWSGVGTITNTYQWQRCDASGANCADIAGATNSTYTPTSEDVGGTVRVVVGATNAGGRAAPVTSAPIAVGPAGPPVNKSRPGRRRPGAQGKVLTADPGVWEGTGPVSYTYQWQRCDAGGANCQDISGATGNTYVPGPATSGTRCAPPSPPRPTPAPRRRPAHRPRPWWRRPTPTTSVPFPAP
jgi:hypothetical protein